MPQPPPGSSEARHFDLVSRLDSWKEIAAYLRRSERTVKRWETDRRLPIHRVPGGGRGSVYAYTIELTEWLKATPAADAPTEIPADPEIEVADPSLTGEAIPPPVVPDADAPVASSKRFVLPRRWMLAACAIAIVFASTAMAVLRERASAPSESVASSASIVSGSEQSVARELFLKGRYEWNQRTPDSLNRALDDFTQAVVHDPNDARSYVGLADTYNLLQIYSTLPLKDSYPRAIAAASRAVALEPSLAEAHRALAFAEFYGAGDWRNSEKEFRLAIKLDPKDPVTRRWYANAFALPGRYEESLAQFDKAQELDPASHSTLSDKGVILYDSGRQEEGIALLKEVERTNPDFFSPHLYLMQIALTRRDYPAFLQEGEKAAELRHDPILKDIIASAREGYARAGARGFLNSLYKGQKAYYVQGKYPGGMLAKTCVALGKRQEALQLLKSAYARHTPDALWCLTEPDLRSLRDEPGYRELIQSINFPAVPSETPQGSQAKESSPP
jgi:tetratricopeptide (TPR) repeat protein